MAPHHLQLPCDADDICMICKSKATISDMLICNTCNAPWHTPCLVRSDTNGIFDGVSWECPDCVPCQNEEITHVAFVGGNPFISAIRVIENDKGLSEKEKAKKRQELMSGGKVDEEEEENKGSGGYVLDMLDDAFNCSFCMNLLERPVTTSCGHNFCLKCFQKWTSQGKRTCVKCRAVIPSKMVSEPRINVAIVEVIRKAKIARVNPNQGVPKVQHFVQNQDKPDEAYTTERAVYGGKANACSGKIFVTVPPDHFGPILAENDPGRNQGVKVGEVWGDRMECRQWGAHLPHVAGIAGQSDYGAQSVALSGGYKDDEDHGEWFLYTGSGGRDLSGNRRTNPNQSFDQKFVKYNEALRVSCKNGYPVRVVRSHKEKRSSYAPEAGVRYDGIYRIEKCWQKVGVQGFKVCRYLFVRCDNEPAPWTSDENGDSPRPLPTISELKKATDITSRKDSPSWDYEVKEGCWKWKKPPPHSRHTGNPNGRKSASKNKNLSVNETLLKEFSCLICRNVMSLPLTTPCAHNFCKPCLEGAFKGQDFIRERGCHGNRRALRTQKNVMKCPCCPMDISDFLQNPQVNRDLMDIIESLKCKIEAEAKESEEEALESDENAIDTDENVEDAEEEVQMMETEEEPEELPVALKANKEVAIAIKTLKRNKTDDEEIPLKKVDTAIETGKKDVETPIEITPVQAHKRKKRNGDLSKPIFFSSVRTRSMRAKELSV